MQSFKVLEIAIVEWIFVVPFYLHGNHSVIENPNVINLVTYRLALTSVYQFLNLKLVLVPTLGRECTTYSLGHRRFAASIAHKRSHGNGEN